MKTKVTIELLVEGDPDDVDSAVESALDAGFFQDGIESYPDAEIRVLEATCSMCTEFTEGPNDEHESEKLRTDPTDE